MAKTVRPGLRLIDRLILVVAWIATCGVVYLMGFYLGKGTQERRLHAEERIVRLPVTSAPPPEGEHHKTNGDLTFYEQLLSGGRAGMPESTGSTKSPSPAAPPSPPAAAPAVAAPPPAAATTPTLPPPHGGTAAAPPAGSAPTHLAGSPAPAAAPPLPHPPAAAPPPPLPHPPAAAPAPAPAARAVSTAPPRTPDRPAVPAPAPAAPSALAKPVTVAPAIASADATAPAAPPRTSGGWTVEADPTRDRDEAEALQKRLRARGYDSTLVRVLRDGETWYRLHIGRYGSAEQASEVMRRLRDSEGVAHVFVATE
jgi:hypothetical protein